MSKDIPKEKEDEPFDYESATELEPELNPDWFTDEYWEEELKNDDDDETA